jgi:hypothetical protein
MLQCHFWRSITVSWCKSDNSFVPRQNTHRLVLAGFLRNPPYEIGVSVIGVKIVSLV